MSISDLNRDLNGLNPLAYMGVNPTTPPQLLQENRAPTRNDYGYAVGTMWLVEGTDQVWIYSGIIAKVITWTKLVASGGVGGDFVWSTSPDITTPIDTVANTGYIANSAGTIVYNLPAICPTGTEFKFTGMNNATGWQVQASAGQTINFGNVSTSPGGTLTSIATYDSVELVCIVDNTTYNVISVVGNITLT
jgi:hypothetical protein